MRGSLQFLMWNCSCIGVDDGADGEANDGLADIGGKDDSDEGAQDEASMAN